MRGREMREGEKNKAPLITQRGLSLRHPQQRLRYKER